MTLQRGLAVLLFGATLLGALAPSFVHVAGWWLAMVPTGMPWLAWVAALVIEGSLFAALFGLHVVKPGMQGRRWNLALLLLGAGASVYANLAWSIGDHAGTWTWIDAMNAMVGAALLPVYAVVTAHAAPHVWTRCSASRRKAGRKLPASRDARPVQPGRKASRKPRKAEALAMIEAGKFDHVKTQAELARALGVSESAVSRWPVERNGGGWAVVD